MNDLLTIRQTAEVLGVSRSTAYALARAGEIPVVRVHNMMRVPAGALETWRDQLERRALAAVRATEPAP